LDALREDVITASGLPAVSLTFSPRRLKPLVSAASGREMGIDKGSLLAKPEKAFADQCKVERERRKACQILVSLAGPYAQHRFARLGLRQRDRDTGFDSCYDFDTVTNLIH
jgi:hypothetical protein